MRNIYQVGETVYANILIPAGFVLVRNLQVVQYNWNIEFTRCCVKRVNQNKEQEPCTPC